MAHIGIQTVTKEQMAQVFERRTAGALIKDIAQLLQCTPNHLCELIHRAETEGYKAWAQKKTQLSRKKRRELANSGYL